MIVTVRQSQVEALVVVDFVVTSLPMLNLGICRRGPCPRALVVAACRRLVEALCFGFRASRGHLVVA